MDVVTGVELECSYGAGDGRTRSGVASMPKERSGGPRLDQSCDWEKYGYDREMQWHWYKSVGDAMALTQLSGMCNGTDTNERNVQWHWHKWAGDAMALKQVSRTHNGTNTCRIADAIKLKQKKTVWSLYSVLGGHWSGTQLWVSAQWVPDEWAITFLIHKSLSFSCVQNVNLNLKLCRLHKIFYFLSPFCSDEIWDFHFIERAFQNLKW